MICKMSEENPKKILFNKSILLSLKAELLKKQEEVQDKKHLPQHKVENFRPSSKSNERKVDVNEQPSKRSLRNNLKAVDTDELEACRKSKLVLEKKAELYEHLADSAGDSQLSEHFLVNFKEKKQQGLNKPEPDKTNVEHNYTEEDETDWVEFTDVLGRTRKCLKSDLEYYKERDEKLQKVLSNDSGNSEKKASEPPQIEKTPLVQTTNEYLQSLREKWEQKERELLAKDKDIHYQDLLFDEARIHGVGYYAFSTDEDERKKQMEELIKRRQETLQAQEKAEEARRKREELVAARVAAARARQRVRAGLPPEDPQEKQKDFTKCLLEFLTQQKNAADSKAKEEEKKAKEELEKERQKLREAYVREWDIGKEGVEGNVKKFREMTQEEYVEKQRSKRINEFAPFQDDTIPNSKSLYVFDPQGNKVNLNSNDMNKEEQTWSSVRQTDIPSTSVVDDLGDQLDSQTKGLYFSTKKPAAAVKYKNFVKAQEPVPIQNELDDEGEHSIETKVEKRKFDTNTAEIAPPTTYEYCGPVPKYVKSQKPFYSNLTEAYAQGSKSLEPKESKARLSKHYDFTFDNS